MKDQFHRHLSLKENFNYALNYSLIFSVVIALIFVIARLTGLYLMAELRFINYIVLFPIGYFGVKSAFEHNSNYLYYFNGLMIGFMIGFLGQLWFTILFVLYTLIDNSVYEFLLNQLPQPLYYPRLAIGFVLMSEGLGASAILSLAMMQVFKARAKEKAVKIQQHQF